MKICYLGHSSFLITDAMGRTLLTDPFDGSIGYPTYKGFADVVTISHHHYDHDYLNDLQGSPKILDKVGFFNQCDIPITGILTYHDTAEGIKRGTNTIYIFEMDGYKLCHLGDLGHLLSKDVLDLIGSIDVLFIPVGGYYTIDGKTAAEISKAINPHIVIPMHYKTPSINFPISGIEEFLTNMQNGERINSNTLILADELSEFNLVKLLDPPNS